MTREPIHPGETLREDLDALGMSAAELARRIEVPVNRINQILNGQRAVTGDTALRLGRFFGTSGRVLAQPAEPVRAETGGKRTRCRDPTSANAGGRRSIVGVGLIWRVAKGNQKRDRRERPPESSAPSSPRQRS